MTDRIPLDHLTSDQYDALCNELAALRAVARGYCPACGRGDAAPTVADWEQQKRRAEQAEAAIERVRAYADRLDTMGNGTSIEADSIRRAAAKGIRAALNDPA